MTHADDLKLTLDENGELIPAAVDREEALTQLKRRIHERLREPSLLEAIPSIISFYGQVYVAARDVTPIHIRIEVRETEAP